MADDAPPKPRLNPLRDLSPDVQRLIDQTVTSMHHLARLELTREQAVEIREQMSRPIGVLADRHHLAIKNRQWVVGQVSS